MMFDKVRKLNFNQKVLSMFLIGMLLVLLALWNEVYYVETSLENYQKVAKLKQKATGELLLFIDRCLADGKLTLHEFRKIDYAYKTEQKHKIALGLKE